MEDIEQYKKELKHLQNIRELFIFVGLGLIVIALSTLVLTFPHVDAHSGWFIPVFFACLILTIIGITLIVFGVSLYKNKKNDLERKFLLYQEEKNQ